MDVTSVDQKANGIIPTSHDEVDFVKVQTQTNNFTNNNNCLLNETKGYANFKTDAIQIPKNQNAKVPKDRMSLFSFSKKSTVKPTDLVTEKEEKAQGTTEKSLSCQQPPVPIGTPPRPKKFAKSSSLSRLLGNTYNAKKFEKNEKKLAEGKFNTFGGRRRSNGPYLERFKHYAKEEGDESGGSIISITTPPPPPAAASASVPISNTKNEDKSKCDTLDRHLMALEHFQERRTGDLSSKAMRTISRGLGKLWWKRTHSIEISTPDPEFKVSYLGNVLTGWAKGEGCVEKQLNTLWRNYTQNTKPDVIMRLKVCASGLKATTRQHGLTEYWANRITHCCAPKNYPRVFCWIYRHEGRKLKHELRCHAVLCSKEKQVQEICDTLKANLERALREFKREKILKQNARLSLANAVYDNPSLPRRKILLSVGSNNYRPPLERSKSAPKLMAIEEAIGEEGEEAEETNEPEMKPCCQKDSLYPAMTLGRRRCRRGHSIRRTGQARPVSFNLTAGGQQQHSCCNSLGSCKETQTTTDKNSPVTEQTPDEETRIHYGSDDSDDFEKILKHNNYDSNASLANELMPYFESQLHLNSTNSCSLSDLREMHHESEESGPLSLLATINIDPNADPINDFNPNHQTNQIPANDSNTQRPEGKDQEDHFDSVALRRSGVCSDGEDDFLGEEEDDIYFRQAAILNMLHRHSMRKMANLSLSSDEGSSSLETNTGVRDTDHIAAVRYKHQQQSSISSDTSSVSCSMANHQSAGGEEGTPSTAKRNQINNDSADEGSISSGCETASTVTQNQDDLSLQFHHGVAHQLSLPPHPSYTDGDLEISSLESTNLTTEDLYKNLQNRNNSDAATTFSSSSSITLKMDSSPTNSMKDLDTISNDAITENPSSGAGNTANTNRPRRTRRQRDVKPDSDSECSDESGYVEYQEKEKSNSRKLEQPKPQVPIKPQVPPKPMPRRFINTQSKNTTTV